MKAKKPKEQYQTVTLFVRYYEDGKMEYCNPYNGEVLFTKQSATGTSPLVDTEDKECVLWCDYHGLACTGCKQCQTISVDTLKTKTYRDSQYFKIKATPYENYLKMVKEKYEH